MSQEKDPKSGIFKNEDGTYTVSVVFKTPKPISKKRLGDMADDLASASDGAECCEDSLPTGPRSLRYIAQVAIAEDEAISAGLPVEDAKPVATSYEDCKAANPMYCPYHGLAAIKDKLSAYMKAKGLQYFNVHKLPSGAYELTANVQKLDSAKKYNDAFQGFLKENGIVAFASTTLTEATGAELSPYKADTVALIADLETHEADYEVIPDIEKALEEGNEAVSPDDYMAYLQALSDGDSGKAQQLADKMQSDLDFDGAELADVEMMMNETAKHYIGLHSEKLSKKNNIANLLEAAGHPNHFPGFKELGESDSLGIQIAKGFEAIHKQLNEALAAGDLQGAKQALEKFMDAVEKYEDTVDLFAKNADAMKQNIAKYADMTKVAPPKDPAEAAKWWAKNGIVHPLELSSAATLLALNDIALKGLGGQWNPSVIGKKVIEQKEDEDIDNHKPPIKSAEPGETEFGSPDFDPFNFPKREELLHDESKFPEGVTQEMLEAALAKGKKAGGGGGLGTKIVEIGGRKYICKHGSGSHAQAIENGFNCDMAYRAGGIGAPDAKLYKFGETTYKLSEFIKGERLDAIMASDDKAKKDAAVAELLKGYPLDALFSNWDVLGTNPAAGLHFSNIIFDKDGRTWRVDNDGAFAATGLVGGIKDSSSGKSDIPGVSVEHWESWKDRKFCDDWFTMRAEKQNKGVFDRYSTHSIFDAAARLDMDRAVESLPEELRAALKKPLSEMKQMTYRCCDNQNGGMCDEGSSLMLDYSYGLSKDGAREYIKGEKSQYSHGFGNGKDEADGYKIQSYSVPEPPAPKKPDIGHDYAEDIIGAARTINWHMGLAKPDGGSIGTPDYQPNADKIKAYEAAKPIVEAAAKAGDKNAKVMMAFIDEIEASKKNGWKNEISHVPVTYPVVDPSEKGKLAEYDKQVKEWEPKHEKWKKGKAEWDAKELAKKAEWDKAHGVIPYANLQDMIDKQCQKAGIDNAWVVSSQHSQGWKSWANEACKSKVVEGLLRGYDIAKGKMPGFWKGNKNTGAVAAYAKEDADSKAKRHNDMAALAVQKAAIQLMLENSTLANKPDAVDHGNHKVFVVRTEGWLGGGSGSEYMEKYGHKANAICKKFETGTCESHAVDSVTGHGAYYGAMVPFSSIVGSHWIHPKPGQATFLGDDEAEFTVDKVHLPQIPIVCFGTTWKSYGEFLAKYKSIVASQWKGAT